MDRRVIPRVQYDFLKKELQRHTQNSLITDEQKQSILNSYEIAESRLNFIRILLLIGSILIGLGVLSFVASNWQYMTNPLKFGLILLLFLGVNLVSFKLSDSYPRISQNLLYLGALVYGAGIFLVGQMFHLGGHFTGAFLLWGIGVLPMSVLFKEKLLFLFVHFLFLIYLNGFFSIMGTSFPYYIILIIPILYYLNRFFGNAKIGTFANNLLLLNTILYLGFELELTPIFVFFILFAVGLVMMFGPIRFNQDVFRIQGNIVMGIAGLMITIDDAWIELYHKYNWDLASAISPTVLSTVFAILYLTFLFYLVKRKSLVSLVFVCLTIFRYYVDTMLDFMPKSIFFITGGLILLGFGYYFERLRKEGGGIDFEE